MRTWKYFFLLILLLAFFFSSNSFASAQDIRAPKGNVRVGIFPFEPFNFIGATGEPEGFNVDLLREISKEKNFSLQFIAGTWAQGLERLQSQEIDLLISVAYSDERSKVMDYAYESIAELWGQVFLRPDSASKNISDLQGKRVAVMRRDISGINFINTAKQLNVSCDIVEVGSHGDVFEAVRDRKVDAGIAPQHFGLRHAQQYGLVASSIMFSPFSIYFAAKKGTQHDLLSLIDTQLARWKSDPNSYFYRQQSHWLATHPTKWQWPAWLIYLLIGSGLLIFTASIFLLS